MGRIRLAAVAAAFALGGCAGGGLGGLGDILGGGTPAPPSTGTLVAEVQSVDEYDREIRVRTQDGQTGDILWDANTRVFYQNREYPVTALENGDIIEMRVQETTGGELYVDRIEVRQSVQERRGY